MANPASLLAKITAKRDALVAELASITADKQSQIDNANALIAAIGANPNFESFHNLAVTVDRS